jgi:hypothetical protein
VLPQIRAVDNNAIEMHSGQQMLDRPRESVVSTSGLDIFKHKRECLLKRMVWERKEEKSNVYII